jgi:hypothetical protein
MASSLRSELPSQGSVAFEALTCGASLVRLLPELLGCVPSFSFFRMPMTGFKKAPHDIHWCTIDDNNKQQLSKLAICKQQR